SHVNPTTRDRMLKYEEHAGAPAGSAGREALRGAGLGPQRVTHLVTGSCSGVSAPGVDIPMVKHLCLGDPVARTHLGFMGCHGLLNGLRVASAFVAADPGARVLLCAIEMCSLHHQYEWHSDQIVANALFADGAAALVGVGDGQSSGPIYRVIASGSKL